jgi:hypothetical protein
MRAPRAARGRAVTERSDAQEPGPGPRTESRSIDATASVNMQASMTTGAAEVRDWMCEDAYRNAVKHAVYS